MADLLNDVVANLPGKPKRTWEAAIPPELMAELVEIREQFWSGTLPGNPTRTGLSKAVARSLASRGIQCHSVTVSRWLESGR